MSVEYNFPHIILRYIYNIMLVISHFATQVRDARGLGTLVSAARGAAVRVRFPDMINVFVTYRLTLARSVPVGYTVYIK